MKESKIIYLNDVKLLSEAGKKARYNKEKAAIKKLLLDICTCKETRRQAKRIVKQGNACAQCVYGSGEDDICWHPGLETYNDETVYMLADYLLNMVDYNEKPPKAIVKAVRKLREVSGEILLLYDEHHDAGDYQ
jgi:hypothetical protein